MSDVSQHSAMPVESMPMAKALNAAMSDAMGEDKAVLLMGEDIGTLGGVFRVTQGLKEEYGPERVMDTPLGEAGIVGSAIGLAMRGYRPVCEIQFDGFVYPSFNQITSQLAKIHARTRGDVKLPVVIRIPYGGNIGSIEHHSESPEALFAHTAGLRVMSPSNAQDAYTMLREAIASDDPVIFLEPKRRYWLKGDVDRSVSAPSTQRAQIVREGRDVTLAAYGPLVPVALAASDAAREDGMSVEVVDLRSISPLDFDAVEASVRKTGRLVVTHEAPTFGGIGGELASVITERCFYSLEAPVLRVGGYHMPYPVAGVEEDYLPSIDRMLEAIDRSLAY
ncbi:alpha-ketoacid dehydrogenase subunit beta [Rothia sp. HC945]|uniref:alpha-ketoacid dehydrogenase subunit beta n=1 Tax=Rothia sp. HC945 TaxID=3171170 RepID=UPI0026529279|nr:alpha-ketoacid dehydrogenase subunit beta [Kocuria sp.]MDN5618553.1 alpha-ketoacid dehydrogenase subunit beta [Kocuria sp.]MDN5654040.1 alpha-ketoacid dehydrogenase subunit beta [Kocuria sp.]